MSTSIIHLRDLSNRRGVFEIDRQLVNNALRGNPEDMAAWNSLFGSIIIVHAENLFAAATIRYVGYSAEFEAVPEGFEPVRYEAIVSRATDADGIVTFTAKWQKISG
jgi:hypothetical protein